MEWIEFLQSLFEGANVVSMVAVMALVWLWGQLGATGKIQLLSSFLTGGVIGILERYAGGTLVEFSAWFYAVLYGVILGALASGFYETIKEAVAKGAERVLGFDEE